jgi:hypothetical protein
MFEGKRGKDCISKTTDILIKKKQKFLLIILRKKKTLIVSLTLRITITLPDFLPVMPERRWLTLSRW